MNPAQTVKQICKDLGVSNAELARRMGQSQQNLGKKLKNETLGYDEFMQALDVMGVKYEGKVIYPGGAPADSVSGDERTRERIALLEAQVELERMNVEFRKNLCRDIRTALYTITGNTEIALKNAKNTDKVKECLGKIKNADAQISIILDDILGAHNAPAENSQSEIPAVDPAAIKGRRVLLAEDNLLNREIAKDVLEDNGLLVEEASDGKEALDMMKKAAPGYYDCVLMDIQMPVMDGLAAAKAIRALPERAKASVPMIAMTANAFDEDKKKSFEAGMDAHLTKPVDAVKLLNTLARFI